MQRIKITILLTVMIAPLSLMAVEPQSKEEQCAQYGSYQDADGFYQGAEGSWQVCEANDIKDES